MDFPTSRRSNIEQSYALEFVRKGIHLCSLSIPIVYFFVSQSTALWILVPLTLAFGIGDCARVYHPPSRKFFHRLFGGLLRNHELDEKSPSLTGASYVLLSACLFIWIFPKVVFITAFSILIISDTLAALVGRRFGRHLFLKKSREGTAAFFLSALAVVAFAPKVEGSAGEFIIGAVAALIGAIVEAWFTSIDDNLSIPFSVGVAMWLMYFLFLPDVNVYALDMLR